MAAPLPSIGCAFLQHFLAVKEKMSKVLILFFRMTLVLFFCLPGSSKGVVSPTVLYTDFCLAV